MWRIVCYREGHSHSSSAVHVKWLKHSLVINNYKTSWIFLLLFIIFHHQYATSSSSSPPTLFIHKFHIYFFFIWEAQFHPVTKTNGHVQAFILLIHKHTAWGVGEWEKEDTYVGAGENRKGQNTELQLCAFLFHHLNKKISPCQSGKTFLSSTATSSFANLSSENVIYFMDSAD